MSIFYNAYFVKTNEPESRLRDKFSRIDIVPHSEWIVCNFGDGYPNGIFEPVVYFTKEISSLYGEAIFICVDTGNDQLEYEHSKSGIILRKLSLISDGCQSTWECSEGETEGWEPEIVFSEYNLKRAMEYLEYDELPQEEFDNKKKQLREIYKNFQYLTGEKWPFTDATIGMAIQKYFGIELPKK